MPELSMFEILLKYKPFLDKGTYEGLRYVDEYKSRYASFSRCLSFLEKLDSPTVVELGTCRSFVDGKFPGCNSDDSIYWDSKDYSKWDWGAGCFGIIFGQIPGIKLHTVDIANSHLKRSKLMLNSIGISASFHLNSSVDFLEKTPDKFDLIYLDTGDMWPIKQTEELQLREAEMIVKKKLLKPKGLLLIDDVLNGTPREMGDSENKLGKSELAIPYLLKNEFEIVFEGYQYILKKC